MSREDITIGQIEELHEKITDLKTIGEWKVCVKKFATAKQLTDREAIEIANRK